MKEFLKLDPRLIGEFSVDSGCVWIGDPCYILHPDDPPNKIGRDWGEFCNIIGSKNAVTFSHNNGIPGLGVLTSTRHGDGYYPIIGFYEEDCDVPSCVVIDFNNVFNKF